MDARFYNSEDIDIERLASDLVNVYSAQGYQAQQIGNRDQMLVQLKKGGDFEAIIGMQAALSLTIQRTAGGVLAMIGQQKWLDKAAVGAVSIVVPVLWPLALTAGVGALRQASLGNQALNMVDGLVRQQRPNVIAGPIPAQLVPQIQQQLAPPSSAPYYTPPPQAQIVAAAPQATLPPAPAPTVLRCPSCNTPYQPGDTFCSGCGRSLVPQKIYCANCHAELNPGVAFCPNCGASTYQPSTTVQAPSRPAPAAPQPPMYTPASPPSSPSPPPAQPTRPAQPIQPQNPYYAPSQQASTPKVEPTPPPAPQPYYVPSVPQEPIVTPQPKVTIMPSEPRQQPAPPAAPPKPETPYYVPSAQAQQTAQKAQTPASPAPQPQPIVATPSAKPAFDPDVVWGTLTFSDGQQMQLKGERAVVGRYDHDLGGITPDVDLGNMQGADTVSRIHAAIERVGSTYTVIDLNSTNATRINGKRLEPDKATPVTDGDTIVFGKVTCTFKKA